MQIAKSSGNLILNTQDSGVSIEVSKNAENLVIDVKYDVKIEKIERPGEFEIGGVEVVGRELGVEVKKGLLNTAFFNLDGVKVLYVSNVNEDLYEWVKTLAFVDLLVITFTDNLKEITNKIDPSKVILFGTELDEAGIKKMGVTQVEKAKQFKFKESDFETLEDENKTAEVLSLN
ncbi:MAG: hypothetical protein ABI721_02190 [Candidatus Dojkabacteria bacterium]